MTHLIRNSIIRLFTIQVIQWHDPQIRQMIGKRLQLQRQTMQLSLSKVANATNLSERFLLGIERGEWHSFPYERSGVTYAEKYAAFVKLDLCEFATTTLNGSRISITLLTAIAALAIGSGLALQGRTLFPTLEQAAATVIPLTPVAQATYTSSPTMTATPSPTASMTATATVTPTAMPTNTARPSATATATPLPTAPPSPTTLPPTATGEATPLPRVVATATPGPKIVSATTALGKGGQQFTAYLLRLRPVDSNQRLLVTLTTAGLTAPIEELINIYLLDQRRKNECLGKQPLRECNLDAGVRVPGQPETLRTQVAAPVPVDLYLVIYTRVDTDIRYTISVENGELAYP